MNFHREKRRWRRTDAAFCIVRDAAEHALRRAGQASPEAKPLSAIKSWRVELKDGFYYNIRYKNTVGNG